MKGYSIVGVSNEPVGNCFLPDPEVSLARHSRVIIAGCFKALQSVSVLYSVERVGACQLLINK